ncbi:histidine phosphatase superfamily [Gigaspora rosea]|uniref:Multiple inositol polyphosphate phosphatase 1 n=1 Tax=Gigaspora rosea TaxID=44941 RepID=A0A397VP49_9GLOM|nr:histidine phosphatase superfamily [Gigaspora rosea]
MQSYDNLYSFFILLFYFYNLALCQDNGTSNLYQHDPQDLISKHYFVIEPAETAFTLNIKPISYPNKCELKQLHLLTRHGSRYPDIPNTLAFDRLAKIFANVSVAKNWYKNPFPLERNYQLIPRGEIEPYYDGKQSFLRYNQFWKNYKKITGRYDPEVVKFQAGAYSRCGASGMAFSEGLFNGDGPLDTCKNQPVYVWNIPANEDNIIEMYNNCLLANETVINNNPEFDEQNYIFGNNTLKPIADRMTNDYGIYPPLDPNVVPSIYDACEFWVLFFNRTDTWCSLLSEDDIIKLAYRVDMIGYYKYSYGNPLNEQIGCVYYTQLVNSVESYLNGSSIMVADLKNGHAHTMVSVLTTLGAAKNPYPLTANLTLSQIKQLKYTAGKSIYWSSTMYFEIYTCSDSPKVRLVLNFEPLLIPGCESEYCKWSTFKKILGDKIGCDFNKLCKNP